MTQVLEVTVGSSEKINLGNYEVKEFSVFLKANVTNEDATKSVLELQARVEALLKDTIDLYLQKNKERMISGASRKDVEDKKFSKPAFSPR